MDSGFNSYRRDKEMNDRQNVSPWIQRLSQTDRCSSEASTRRLDYIPPPPPPPTFRNHASSHSIGSSNMPEVSSGNPYGRHASLFNQNDSRYEERAHLENYDGNWRFDAYDERSSGSRSEKHFSKKHRNEQEYGQPHRRYRRERQRSPRPKNHSDQKYEGDSDIICISPTTNLNTGTYSDVSIDSPDCNDALMKPHISTDSRSLNQIEPHKSFASELDRAYHQRRNSQTSESSEISIIPNPMADDLGSDRYNPVGSTPKGHARTYTPASPDRRNADYKHKSGKQIQSEATTNTGTSKKSSLQKDKPGQSILPLSSSQPTIIPLYPEPHPIVGGEKTVNICRLCKSEKRSFKSDYDFHMHLTKIHYEDRLMKRIISPYKCQICFYSPPECMSVQEKEEDLLIHYGCNEGVSYQFYQDDYSKLAPINEISTETSKVAMSCELCKSSHQGERLFVRHITLRHFTKELSDELPKTPPFICPFVDCNQEKTNGHLLIMHYGVEHNISMELYNKSQIQATNSRDPRTCTTKDNNDRRKEGDEYSLPKLLVDFEGKSSLPSLSLPPISLPRQAPKTISKATLGHTEARKRQFNVFQDTQATLLGLTTKISKIKPLKQSEHKDDLLSRNKSNQVPPSKEKKEIVIKRKTFKTKGTNSFGNAKKVRSADDRSTIDKIATTRYITNDIQHSKMDNTKKRKANDTGDSSNEFAGLQEIDLFAPKDSNSPQKLDENSFTKDDSEVLPPSISKPNNTASASNDFKSTHASKSDIISVISARQRMRDNWEKTSIDCHNNEILSPNKQKKGMEVSRIQQMRAKTDNQKKIILEKEKSLKAEKHTRKDVEQRLEKALVEIEGLKLRLKVKQPSSNDLEENLSEKHNTDQGTHNTQEKLKKNIDLVGDMELSMFEEENEFEDKEINENDLQNIETHTVEIDDKNQTIAVLKAKCEELETKYDQALETLCELKDSDKQNKDTQKHVKQLQTTLEEYKNRQSTNAREFKNLKENHDHSEKLISETKALLKARDGTIINLRSQIETQKAKLAGLEQCPKETHKLQEAEVQQLLVQIENKDKEVKHLRKALDNCKVRAKLDIDRHNIELNDAKKTTDQFEMEYSKALQKVEEFKTILSDAEQNIIQKDNQLGSYSEAINDRNIIILKDLIHGSRNQRQIEDAARVMNEMEEALTKVNSRLCINPNIQDFLIKNEPLDEGEELVNSYHGLTQNGTNQNLSNETPLAFANQTCTVNTDNQMNLYPPIITDMDVSAIVKQEPGTESPAMIFSSSHELRNHTSDNSSVVNASEAMNFPLHQTSNYSGQNQLLQGLAKSTLSVQQPLSMENSALPQNEKFNDNYIVDMALNANTAESQESDADSDDFTYDTDPLSGLSYAAKVEKSLHVAPKSLQHNHPKPSTSMSDFKRMPAASLEDVTEKYVGPEESYVCGICNQHELPQLICGAGDATDWFGCDCDRWFHKSCTKKKKFSKNFSCKSVKMKCL